MGTMGLEIGRGTRRPLAQLRLMLVLEGGGEGGRPGFCMQQGTQGSRRLRMGSVWSKWAAHRGIGLDRLHKRKTRLVSALAAPCPLPGG